MPSKELIELTKKEFKPYKEEITDDEACEIIKNFTGFAELLLKWNERMQQQK